MLRQCTSVTGQDCCRRTLQQRYALRLVCNGSPERVQRFIRLPCYDKGVRISKSAWALQLNYKVKVLLWHRGVAEGTSSECSSTCGLHNALQEPCAGPSRARAYLCRYPPWQTASTRTQSWMWPSSVKAVGVTSLPKLRRSGTFFAHSCSDPYSVALFSVHMSQQFSAQISAVPDTESVQRAPELEPF